VAREARASEAVGVAAEQSVVVASDEHHVHARLCGEEPAQEAPPRVERRSVGPRLRARGALCLPLEADVARKEADVDVGRRAVRLEPAGEREASDVLLVVVAVQVGGGDDGDGAAPARVQCHHVAPLRGGGGLLPLRRADISDVLVLVFGVAVKLSEVRAPRSPHGDRRHPRWLERRFGGGGTDVCRSEREAAAALLPIHLDDMPAGLCVIADDAAAAAV